jgi:PTS system nitrogen regulatory IIA component
MDLSVRDVAGLLNVSENTVYRWVREGTLPSHRVHDQYRLNRVELQEWAATHGHRVSPDLFASSGSEELPSLAAALERGGIHHGLAGSRREEILGAVTKLPGIPDGVDRELLYQLLLAREALAPTGVGRGIALPHPRDPVVLHLREPRVLLCFPETPVAFGALDGEPVRALFLLLSPSVHAHLQMLARLAYALHDDALLALLDRREAPDVLMDRVRALESKGARR